MKRLAMLLIVVLLVSIGLASQVDANIAGSGVTGVTPGTLPVGVPTNITFTFLVTTTDLEYLDYFEVLLPPQWTINSVINAPATSDCEVGSIQGADGQYAWWQTDSEVIPSECGAWWDGNVNFTVNVTVNSCTGSPWTLPWFGEGDYYVESSAPHSVSGAVSVGATGCSTTASKVPGCDFGTGITPTTTGGLFIQNAIVYSVPGQVAVPPLVIEAGKIFYVDKLDPTRTYRQALLGCTWVWVEADTVVAPQAWPWNGKPLTVEVLQTLPTSR